GPFETCRQGLTMSVVGGGPEPSHREFAKIQPKQLKRDEIGMNRHRALGCFFNMIFSENLCTLFRIML
ncbi:hypothetical protein, partial [Bradyrhizobium sp. CCBAU 11434]|uniref:hypothetical protein n=1 Tax=Bradyrhizobium sp. CCBAU 11434 TaxID=1630885 RepID=UPI002306B83F